MRLGLVWWLAVCNGYKWGNAPSERARGGESAAAEVARPRGSAPEQDLDDPDKGLKEKEVSRLPGISDVAMDAGLPGGSLPANVLFARGTLFRGGGLRVLAIGGTSTAGKGAGGARWTERLESLLPRPRSVTNRASVGASMCGYARRVHLDVVPWLKETRADVLVIESSDEGRDRSLKCAEALVRACLEASPRLAIVFLRVLRGGVDCLGTSDAAASTPASWPALVSKSSVDSCGAPLPEEAEDGPCPPAACAEVGVARCYAEAATAVSVPSGATNGCFHCQLPTRSL